MVNALSYIYVAIVFKLTSATPPDYCLMPANLSDCGRKPTTIFSYYRPGSRCEIEVWRGCPTLNKFGSQYECHDHCIFQAFRQGISQDEAYHVKYGNDGILVDGEEKVNGTEKPGTATHIDIPPRCREDLNISEACSDKTSAHLVYTFDNKVGECQEKLWYRCRPSENKFDSAKECAEVCLGTQVEWEEELHNLGEDEAADLNQAVEEADDNTDKDPSDNHNDLKPEHNHGDITNLIVEDNSTNKQNGNNTDDGINGENNDNQTGNGNNNEDKNSNKPSNDDHDNENNGNEIPDKLDTGDKDNSDDQHDEDSNDGEQDGSNGEDKKSSGEEESDSGEPKVDQVNYVTTPVIRKLQYFKKPNSTLKYRRSARLLKFLSGNKDYYVL